MSRRGSSSTRSERTHERNELQDLNKRLEFYILRQREKDARSLGLQREVESIRDSIERERENLLELHGAQLEAVEGNYVEQEEENAELENIGSQQDKELATLKAKMTAQKKLRVSLEAKGQKLSQEMQTGRNQLLTLSSEEKKHSHQLGLNTQELAAIQEEFDKAQERSGAAGSDREETEARAAKLAAALEKLLRTSDAESRRLQEQVGTLSLSRASVEDELRKEFSGQLKELLATKQNEWDQEKEAALAALKNTNDVEMARLREGVKTGAAELDACIETATDLRMNIAEMKTKSSDTTALQTSLKAQLSELQTRSKGMKTRNNVERDAQNELVHKLQANAAQNSENFDVLMDEKVTLEREIAKYRALLDKEESVTGEFSPKPRSRHKKARGRSPLKSTASRLFTAEAETEAEAEGDWVVVDSEEVEGAESSNQLPEQTEGRGKKRRRGTAKPSATVRSQPRSSGAAHQAASKDDKPLFIITDLTVNAVTVTNDSSESKSLNGWSLRLEQNGATLKTFFFPEAAVAANSHVEVVFEGGKSKRSRGKKQLSFEWEGQRSVMESAAATLATLVLVDFTGLSVSQVEIAPQ